MSRRTSVQHRILHCALFVKNDDDVKGISKHVVVVVL